MLNFVSLIRPIYSNGLHLNIRREVASWKPEMFALLASIGAKVRKLTIWYKMNFAEFLFVKNVFLKNAIQFHNPYYLASQVI